MPDYHERLRVPVIWWLIAAGSVLVLGTELFAGFSLTVGIVVYLVLAAVCAATLLHWGGAVVEVSDGELRAGPARLPLAAAGEVRPLDGAQTRAMRGLQADPAAWLLVRPYLKQSVYVEVTGGDANRPYLCRRRWRLGFGRVTRTPANWPYLLVGSRQPARLAEAIGRSRAAVVATDQRWAPGMR
jgi:hypothetical protein